MNRIPNEIEQKVIAVLRNIPRLQSPWPQGEPTRMVKNAVGRLGSNEKFQVYHSEKNCEWLYDVCWCQESGKDGWDLDEMSLALESEFGQTKNDLLWDFQKLLVSRANHREFLCTLNKEQWNILTDCVERQVQHYRGTQVGDRYLLGNWESDWNWTFHLYVYSNSPGPE
jgi:hypothetical protein